MNKSYVLNLAITMAVISIVLFLLSAVMGSSMYLSLGILLISIVLTIVLPIIFVRRQRSQANGILSFKEAFTTAFLGLTLSGIIYVAFTFLYVNVIDTSFVDTMTTQQLEMSMKFMEGRVSDDLMVETLTKAENDIRYNYTLLGMLRNLGIYIVFYAIVSLIIAAVMKRNPVIVSTSEEIIDN